MLEWGGIEPSCSWTTLTTWQWLLGKLRFARSLQRKNFFIGKMSIRKMSQSPKIENFFNHIFQSRTFLNNETPTSTSASASASASASIRNRDKRNKTKPILDIRGRHLDTWRLKIFNLAFGAGEWLFETGDLILRPPEWKVKKWKLIFSSRFFSFQPHPSVEDYCVSSCWRICQWLWMKCSSLTEIHLTLHLESEFTKLSCLFLPPSTTIFSHLMKERQPKTTVIVE